MNDLWALSPRYGELWAGDELVCRFNPADSSDRGLYITVNGVEGWDTLPDAKVELHERGQGDGAHDVPETDILYSARTVTVHYEAVGYSRADLLSLMRRINTAAHRSCRLRMVDGDEDTYCEGYVAQMGRDSQWNPLLETNLTLHFVCPRPERLSWRAKRFQLFPIFAGNWSGGIRYGDGRGGLAYPVSYGAVMSDGRNVCSLVNDGSSRAYPVFALHGPLARAARCSSPVSDASGMRLRSAGLSFWIAVRARPCRAACRLAGACPSARSRTCRLPGRCVACSPARVRAGATWSCMTRGCEPAVFIFDSYS